MRGEVGHPGAEQDGGGLEGGEGWEGWVVVVVGQLARSTCSHTTTRPGLPSRSPPFILPYISRATHHQGKTSVPIAHDRKEISRVIVNQQHCLRARALADALTPTCICPTKLGAAMTDDLSDPGRAHLEQRNTCMAGAVCILVSARYFWWRRGVSASVTAGGGKRGSGASPRDDGGKREAGEPEAG